ncbi:thyroid transcription factor 1-associated protein 26 [Amyelois transitella]|uniref:thyroid transcription factor 1-associated protein 26 n=1 Tax=Amyelois transitella TaxID=680683 RepID=UPI00299015D2|nr:thyroid transcription factor 1-associated protein 26 [Amyelois transitella]
MDSKKDSFFFSNKKGNPKNDDSKQQQKEKRQNQFNKNRNIGDAGTKKEKSADEKKPFDKKTYRLKKYSKKYKLEQWEEQRKKKLLRNYYKDVKNETAGSYKPKSFDEDNVDSGKEVGKFVRHPDLIEKENKIKNKDPFQKAKEQYSKIQQEKLEKKHEKEKMKEERMQKLQEYKKKKQDRFKKLSRKTKKGQPVMTGRLELLLEKIQKGGN